MERKYPILELIEPSEFDERIDFLFQAIRSNQLCWMAFEQLDEILDRKQRKGLFFAKESNTIAIRSKTQKLLARIWFETKPIQSDQKPYRWTL